MKIKTLMEAFEAAVALHGLGSISDSNPPQRFERPEVAKARAELTSYVEELMKIIEEFSSDPDFLNRRFTTAHNELLYFSVGMGLADSVLVDLA